MLAYYNENIQNLDRTYSLYLHYATTYIFSSSPLLSPPASPLLFLNIFFKTE